MNPKLRIYDNGGQSFDRYTAVYLSDVERETIDGPLYSARGMSENPTHPQGFGQMTSAMDGPHLGQRISIMQLPERCRELVLSDLRGSRITIESLFEQCHNAIFRIDSDASYSDTVQLLIDLSNAIKNTETDESIWYLGETGACDLGSLIVGAYWHFYEWHGGQFSDSYIALCSLGQIFNPGMVQGPETETAEHDCYLMLEKLAQEANQ